VATERAEKNPRSTAQAAVLKKWGQQWRKTHGKSQQDLGRAAGYGSEQSPKSAAVAISRIESAKTVPAGPYLQRLLETLGHDQSELDAATDAEFATPTLHGMAFKALAGATYVENEARQKQIVAASNQLTERVSFQLQQTESTLDRARTGFILPFLDAASSINWPRLVDMNNLDLNSAGDIPSEREIRQLRQQTQVTLLGTISEGASGAIAGAGLGAGTAAGIFAAVSAAATASTGTAIASLSGAAASSATLAWLGGGTLAAGGMGVAGGTAVLTGIVALPALLAIGGVLVWKGHRLRKEADAESAKLDVAEQALFEMQDALPRAERWNEAQQRLIQRAELLGRTIQVRLLEPHLPSPLSDVDVEHPLTWSQLTKNVQEALAVELQLLSVIVDINALPIWLRVTSVSQPDLDDDQARTATTSEEWIARSLLVAQSDLDRHERWVREQINGTPSV
jgi:transcriptional regulator with XRE-family HTH domain